MRQSFVAAAWLAATASAHGNVTSPPARLPGPGMVQACGQPAVDAVLQDGTLPLEDVLDVLPSCKLDLCRGAVFEDNKDRVQSYAAGEVINFRAILPIPHEGPANVSVVRTQTNSVLGAPLIVFDSYADEKLAVLPANNTDFNVTIPAGDDDVRLLAAECAVAGRCVLQWFWFGTEAKQTYESCVDFVFVAGDAGSAPGNGTSGSNGTVGGGVGSGGGSGNNGTAGSGSGSNRGSGRGSGSGSGTGFGNNGTFFGNGTAGSNPSSGGGNNGTAGGGGQGSSGNSGAAGGSGTSGGDGSAGGNGGGGSTGSGETGSGETGSGNNGLSGGNGGLGNGGNSGGSEGLGGNGGNTGDNGETGNNGAAGGGGATGASGQPGSSDPTGSTGNSGQQSGPAGGAGLGGNAGSGDEAPPQPETAPDQGDAFGGVVGTIPHDEAEVFRGDDDDNSSNGSRDNTLGAAATGVAADVQSAAFGGTVGVESDAQGGAFGGTVGVESDAQSGSFGGTVGSVPATGASRRRQAV